MDAIGCFAYQCSVRPPTLHLRHGSPRRGSRSLCPSAHARAGQCDRGSTRRWNVRMNHATNNAGIVRKRSCHCPALSLFYSGRNRHHCVGPGGGFAPDLRVGSPWRRDGHGESHHRTRRRSDRSGRDRNDTYGNASRRKRVGGNGAAGNRTGDKIGKHLRQRSLCRRRRRQLYRAVGLPRHRERILAHHDCVRAPRCGNCG